MTPAQTNHISAFVTSSYDLICDIVTVMTLYERSIIIMIVRINAQYYSSGMNAKGLQTYVHVLLLTSDNIIE